MNKGMQKQKQKIMLYVIIGIVIFSFLATIVVPLWM